MNLEIKCSVCANTTTDYIPDGLSLCNPCRETQANELEKRMKELNMPEYLTNGLVNAMRGSK